MTSENRDAIEQAPEHEGVSRRSLLTRSAALGGTLVASSALGAAPAIAKRDWQRHRQAGGPVRLPPPPPPPPTELQVEMVPLSHGDLSFTGQKWADNGFTWSGSPLWFWWGYITGMPGQKNPILVIREFTNAGAIGALNHSEFQPGLFRAGVDLGTASGSYFSSPAGPSFSGALDPGGYHQRPFGAGDPDNLGGPNELTYTMSGTAADGRAMLYNAGTKAHHMVEKTTGGATFFDIRADYCPLTPAITPPAPFALYFSGAAVAQGTYRGRNVFYMSGFDRFMTSDSFIPVFANPLYQALVFSGIHEDGSREWGAAYLTGSSSTNYTSFGAYCRDGEQPICSHNIHIDGTWVRNANNHSQISPLKAVYGWEQDGRSVELNVQGTHSAPMEVFCEFSSNHGPRTFARQMCALEYNITPGSVPIAFDYTPSTALS